MGLCEAGLIRGIPRGIYTRSKANKKYAIMACQSLRLEPHLLTDQDRLWIRSTGGNSIRHNEQIDVVCALWRSGLISGDGDPG